MINQSIFFIQSQGKGKFVKIKKDEIIYLESKANYLHIHMIEDSYQTYLTMAEIAVILPTSEFIRVHKSFVVNLTHLVSINGNYIHLKNEIKIALGRNYRAAFFDKINPLLIKSKR
ncbi:DNA-binding LytR/AlgR family response regulator [Pedobacter sp. AK017]|uniref:LytR/AlgR family response regulator transcription factor n=1 Tax=Pedobacter sp. AK017 TaxID=2723073 RepID=UPI00161E111A|nr:LytTR family DNA-binding domain-containing protein [Pedobacter sp. AK017]MBB5440083.1 DNA-binding LytR/AlgR family response regulator [Pedobacter sp. AK017]